MSDQSEHDDLERKARTLFEDSVERLDAHTRSKLTQARNRAVDEVKQGATRRRQEIKPPVIRTTAGRQARHRLPLFWDATRFCGGFHFLAVSTPLCRGLCKFSRPAC